MSNIVTKVQSWDLPDSNNPESVFIPSNDGSKKRGSHWILADNISQYDLYCYLKVRFGPPNGPLMSVRQDSTNNITQWHYTLRSGSQPIDIVGMISRTEFWFKHMASFTAQDGKELIANIKVDFFNHRDNLNKVRQRLEKYHLFINPYKRLSDIIDDLSIKLAALKIADVQLPKTPTTAVTKKQAEDWHREVNLCIQIFREASVIGASIKMIVPVLGESFINLLIFILAKSEVKNDQRLYKDLINKQIDVRVKSLHLYCEGLSSPVDASSDKFKNFHTLMNARNDILHGNIDPMRLKFDEVYFDGTIPLFPNYKDFSTRGTKESLSGIEPETVMADVKVVREFIQFVLDHLKPDYRASVQNLMDDPKPGWREDTKRVGILFSEFAEMMMIKK